MNETTKEYLAGKYECTEDGIYFPSSRILAQGVFSVNKRGEPEEYSTNLVVTEGLDYLLAQGLAAAGGAHATWYIALYTGSVTIAGTLTKNTFADFTDEWTDYDSGTHPQWDQQGVATGGIDSFASKASFVASAAATVRGAALLSISQKPTPNSGTGTLMAASNFNTPKALDIDEILDVGYGLQLTAVP